MKNWLRFSFNRITTNGRFIPEIDGMRFVAVALVVVHHVWSIWSAKAGRPVATLIEHSGIERCFEFCAIGVQLFFMISGFILAMPFLEAIDHRGPAVNLRQYFLRRLTRLEPPYLISMLLFFALGLALGRFSFVEHWDNLIASLFYVHNFAYGEGSLINNNAWSLEIEVQFYLLVPWLVWLFRARPQVRRMLLVAAVIAGSWLSLKLPAGFPKTLLSALQYFLGGFLLCDLYLSVLRDLAIRARWADVVGLGIWVGIGGLAYFPTLPALREFALPFLFVGYAVCVFAGRSLRALHGVPFITVVGGMCYSIYLLHARLISVPLEFGLDRLARFESVTANVALLTAVLVPGVLAGSAVFFLFVERPCMRRTWPQDLWRRICGRAPACATAGSAPSGTSIATQEGSERR